MTLSKLITAIKGGSGSGNFGHSGRPGKRGGSAGGNYVMTAQQAALWNKDSALKVHAYHGTDKANFDYIKSNGFSLAENRSTSGHFGLFGKGIYMSTDPTIARNYGVVDWSVEETPLLTLAVNVKNVANEDDFIRIARESGYYKNSAKMKNPDEFLTGEFKKRGYDAVHVNDEIVVFDPENVRVVQD